MSYQERGVALRATQSQSQPRLLAHGPVRYMQTQDPAIVTWIGPERLREQSDLFLQAAGRERHRLSVLRVFEFHRTGRLVVPGSYLALNGLIVEIDMAYQGEAYEQGGLAPRGRNGNPYAATVADAPDTPIFQFGPAGNQRNPGVRGQQADGLPFFAARALHQGGQLHVGECDTQWPLVVADRSTLLRGPRPAGHDVELDEVPFDVDDTARTEA